MSGFTDRFGGSQIQPSNVGYRLATISLDQVCYWPEFANGDNVLPRFLEVNATVAGADIILPDATLAGAGSDVTIRNIGALAFNVMNADLSVIYSILPGQAIYIYLTSNTTRAGVWGSIQLGNGVSILDLAASAGNGLVTDGATLAVSPIVSEVAGNTLISQLDRAKMYIWRGGTGLFTLPLSATVGQFYFGVRNQGSGALTVSASGGEVIDGSASIILQVGESCLIHASTGAWDTIGRGRATQFNFTQLQKAVTGGTVTLSLTEAANVVQTYTGTLTSNVDIVVPAVVQVYYISNQTSGGFNFRVKNPGTGLTVSLPTGQNAVLFSDGTNIINAATTVAGIGALLFGPGSAGTPSVAIGASTTGLYSANTGEVSVSSNGTKVAAIDGSGIRAVGAGVAISAASSAGTASINIDRPAGSFAILGMNTAGVQRWTVSTSNEAETGSNVGSNFGINRYSDAGAYIDSPFAINRASGQVSVNGLRDTSVVGRIDTFACDSTILPPNCLLCNGALVSRAAYPALFAFATASGLVSEANWSTNQYFGRFSVGDGSTTFRLPDLRGVWIRGLDAGRGLDGSRQWGLYQDTTILSHTHGINDPSHAHSVYDPTHAHSIADGGHAHGISDPGHAHTYTAIVGNGGVAQNGFGWNQYQPQAAGTGGSGTGIGINGAGTGIGIYGAATGIGIYGAGTGISIQAAGSAESRVRNIAYPLYVRYA